MRPGDALELFAHINLANTFFEPFVFPSPQRPNGKELIDSVVLFSDCLLLVEAKAKEKVPFYEPQETELGWARRKVIKALRQIKGAYRQLREGRVCAVTSRLRGTVPVPPLADLCCYGIVVLGHRALPYNPHLLVPELGKANLPIHVFSAADFGLLMAALTTPIDFVVYLDTRASTLGGLNTPVHAEREFFRYYGDNFEQLIFRGGSRRIYVPKFLEPQGALLRHGRHVDWEYGCLIDDILERCCATLRSPNSVAAEIGHPADKQAVAAVMEELGLYSRLHRIHLGKRLHSLLVEVTGKGTPGHFCTCSRSAKRVTVFVASQEPRPERAKHMVVCTDIALAYWQPQGIEAGLGIATEPIQGVGRSYDFVLRRPCWTETQRRQLADMYPSLFQGGQVYLVDA